MQTVHISNELELMLDAYLDPFARVLCVGQVVTTEGFVYRGSEGYSCELHRSGDSLAVIVTGVRGMWLFMGTELAYVGDERLEEHEASGVVRKTVRS